MNKDLLRIYETDASQFKGNALDVVTPKTILEVRNIVAKSSRIVPRGGGTGLAGGCIPQNGVDLVLDLSKLESGRYHCFERWQALTRRLYPSQFYQD